MAQQFFDNYATTLASAITTASTSVTVVQGIPEAVASGNFIALTLTQPDVSGVNQETTWEVITVPGPLTVGQTALTGVTRGTEITNGVAAASTVANWPAGSKCQARLTKGGLNSLAGASGVSQIIAGTGVTISPAGGTGAVTINASGGGGGTITAVNATGTGLSASTTGGVVTLTGNAVTAVTSSVPGVTATNTSGSVALSGAVVNSVTAGTGVTVTGTAANPIINATGGSGTVTSVSAGTNVTVTGTASAPIINVPSIGVTSVTNADAGLTVTNIAGAVTIYDNGVLSITAGTGVTLGGTAQNPVISSSGIASITGGTGISATTVGGATTLANTGVTSVTGGSGITVSSSTGGVTISSSGTSGGVLAQWGIPVGILPSGTFGSNGAVTFASAVSVVWTTGLWAYFPANAITGSNAAGTYWTVMGGTTSAPTATVYNTTLAAGTAPFIPVSPTPFSGTTGGAYTQPSSNTTIFSIPLPANSLGANGQFEFYGRTTSVTTGAFQINLGSSGSVGLASSGNGDAPLSFKLSNAGVTNRQIVANSTVSNDTYANGTLPTTTTADTTTALQLSFVAGFLNGTTANVVLIFGRFNVYPTSP